MKAVFQDLRPPQPTNHRASAAGGATPPETFSARFCEEHRCGLEEFVPAVLRRCMARRALHLFLLARQAEFFAADRELVQAAANAVVMEEIRDAVDEYWSHPANRSWLRRMVGLRLSTLRLRRLANEYLPFANPNRPWRGQRTSR